MIFCLNCGAPAPDGARLCANCGMPLGDPQPAEVRAPRPAEAPAPQAPVDPRSGIAGAAGAGAPPAYPPGPAGAAPPSLRRTDGRAIAALVLGTLGVVAATMAPILVHSIAAIVLGRASLRRIRESGGALAGTGLARTGFVLGIVGLCIQVALLLFVLAVLSGDWSF